MASSNPGLAANAESQLMDRRKVLLTDIRTRMHNSDDPGKLALTHHLEAVGEWAEADLLNDTDIAMLGQELIELREVDGALLRIKAGNYGVCADCGATIPAARMLVQATAQRCIACQAESEKRHGETHGVSV